MKKINQIPRFRGRVGKGDDGKFYYEISLWDFYATKMIGEPFTFGPFEKEKDAHENMRLTVKALVDKFMKDSGLTPTNQFMNMKNGGQLEPWDRS